MSDRLTEIRISVERDGAKNCEDAYADRAWLLRRYDALLAENKRLINGQVLNNPHINGQAAEQFSPHHREMLGLNR